MTDRQAYLAMFNYLGKIWSLYQGWFNSEFPVLLGSMRLLEDGGPADPAVWEDWQEILSHKSMLTENEAFDAMLRFVSYYRNHNEHDEIPRVLEIIRSDSPTLQETWRTCVRDVMAD